MTTMRPTEDDNFMEMAFVVAKRATCSRLQVGAVLVDDRGRTIGTGRNGAPPGVAHCEHRCDCGHDFEDPSGWDWHLSDCISNKACVVSVHAEANTLMFAARSAMNGTLYTTHSPCTPCANLILASGVSRLIYSMEYRTVDSLDLLRSAGVLVERI